MIKFHIGVQKGSPIDSFVTPVAAPMAGYPHDEIMASGTFTQGSTIELSCALSFSAISYAAHSSISVPFTERKVPYFMGKLRSRQKSLSSLTQEEMARLSSEDSYPSSSYVFSAHGYNLLIDNEMVAEAFAELEEQERSILILYCVLNLTDDVTLIVTEDFFHRLSIPFSGGSHCRY